MSKSLMRTENEILGQIIRDITNEGYGIEIEDTGAEMMVHAVDFDKPQGDDRYHGFVKFVWGNGGDCLSDYSINLEKVIAQSIELQKFLAD